MYAPAVSAKTKGATSTMPTRIIIDILLLGDLFFLMAFPYTHKGPHVVAGVLFFLLLIVHHAVNIRWAKSLSRGRWTRKRRIETFVNGALAVIVVLLFYSSLFLLAKHHRWPIPLPGTRQLAQQIHMASSYWGFLLMSLHLGLQGNWLISLYKKYISPSTKALAVGNTILWLLAAGGVYAFISLRWIDYLFLLTHFMDWNQDMGAGLFILAHGAIMALCGRLGWCCCR